MIIIKKFKTQLEAQHFLKTKIGVYDGGLAIMTPKTEILNVFIKNVDNRAASILKQNILSIGGDAAVSADVVRFQEGKNDILVMATKTEILKLSKKLSTQPYGLKNISKEIENLIKKELEKHKKTQVMGILNITPDSFSDGGQFLSEAAAVARAEAMISEGADIIDIGAESSRPNSEPISEEEELQRLSNILKEVRRRFDDILISVDTYKANVAQFALSEGVDIINDISSFEFDQNMHHIIARNKAKVILMHMQNSPKNMQNSPKYDDVVYDILKYLKVRIDFALSSGIKKENIIIDPGIGFGKTLEHNLEILSRIEEFKVLGFPILVGASRKSFIGQATGRKIHERLFGSLAVAAIMQNKNIDFLRVHDVAATKDVINMASLIS